MLCFTFRRLTWVWFKLTFVHNYFLKPDNIMVSSGTTDSSCFNNLPGWLPEDLSAFVFFFFFFFFFQVPKRKCHVTGIACHGKLHGKLVYICVYNFQETYGNNLYIKCVSEQKLTSSDHRCKQTNKQNRLKQNIMCYKPVITHTKHTWI